jgi:hypothetical protein
LPTQNIKFANVLNYATQKNKPPKKSEFVKRGKEDSFGKLLSEFDIIYVCGELPKVAVHWAREYFWLGKVRFVFIPHPSPKNRVWNDPQMFEIVAKSIGAEYENTVFEKLEKNKERCLP